MEKCLKADIANFLMSCRAFFSHYVTSQFVKSLLSLLNVAKYNK